LSFRVFETQAEKHLITAFAGEVEPKFFWRVKTECVVQGKVTGFSSFQRTKKRKKFDSKKNVVKF